MSAMDRPGSGIALIRAADCQFCASRVLIGMEAASAPNAGTGALVRSRGVTERDDAMSPVRAGG
jgi:hypothetical protein